MFLWRVSFAIAPCSGLYQ